MRTYPIMLRLAGRRAVVVGGGAVGMRKIAGLLAAGADVTLVTPEPPADALAGVNVLTQPYAPDTLAGAFLVFACTNEADLNARISADARAAGALVNSVDRPDECDFHVPAVVADGDVVVAIGTAGASPALAANLKRRLAAALGPRVGEFAALLTDLRSDLRAAESDVDRRGEIMRDLSSDATYTLFLDEGPQAVRRRFIELLKS